MAVDSAAGEQLCPDPSAHDHQNKLSAQASSAALYVTQPERASISKDAPKESVLGADGKLSSKSAAASLKHARPQDLPSFPTVGISTSSAGAAAMLAKDYKMKDLWHPEASEAGSRAALLAHRDGGKLDLWQPTASKDGNSAAVLAMQNKTLSPQLDRDYTKLGQSNALLAATKSQKAGRQRAGSTPVPANNLYPDQANSAYNALNAATVSVRSSAKSPLPHKGDQGYNSTAMQAARVHNIGANVAPEMWGEHPPVEIEQQEKRHNAALRASAISMAKQLYEHQNRTIMVADPSGNAGAEAAQARSSATSTAPADLKQEALRYIHLQDAAQKLAHERLAKVDKNFETARYREYYGYNAQPQRSRLSVRGRNRTRASSEGNGDRNLDQSSDDEEGARRVRSQMNQFSSALADVDAKKQATDRKALLAAAERNVNKSMNNMDEKVFQQTGKVSQSKMDEWAAKAREKAERENELRNENRGKMHIGGGKFMEQSEIEAIAQARLQPTLNEINDTAEKKRAHDEEVRLEKEEQERQKREEKAKLKEEKDEQKKARNEEKAAAKKEKDERKAAEKAEKRKSTDGDDKRKSFLSRLSSKRKSREIKKEGAGTAAVAGTAAAVAGTTAAVPTAAGTTTADADTPAAGADIATTTSVERKLSSADVERPADDTAATEEADQSAAKTETAPLALQRTHTGSYTDAIPTPAVSRKPDLERHISKIEDSPTSDSDDDWDGSDDDEAKKHQGLPVATADSSGTAAAAAAVPEHDPSHAQNVAERVVSAPIVNGSDAANTKKANSGSKNDTPTEDAPSSSPAVTGTDEPRPTEEKESTGFRGFFSKLRTRQTKPPAERTTSTTVENRAPTVTGTTATALVSQTGPTAEPTPLSANELVASASPSSFKRRRSSSPGGHSNVSSLSSSGLEEDDLNEGRTGRMVRAMGLGKSAGKPTEQKGADDSAAGANGSALKTEREDDSDQFEEARDHFDEGLAPQPAFGGQAKSHSPARETKFHEEV